MLYLTRDHATIHAIVGAIEVDAGADITSCLDSYVEVEGVYSSSDILRLSQVEQISLRHEGQRVGETCYQRGSL